MKTFLNYIFYIVFFWEKKIMKISGFSSTTFFPSCAIIGLILSLYFYIFFDLISFFYEFKFFWSDFPILVYIPLFLSFFIYVFYSSNNNSKKALFSILRMSDSKRKKVKFISFFHTIILFSIFFIMNDIIREMKYSDGPSYIKYLYKFFFR